MIFVDVASQSISGFTNLVTLIALETWMHNMDSFNMAGYVGLQAGDLLANQAAPESCSSLRHQLHLLRDQVVQF